MMASDGGPDDLADQPGGAGADAAKPPGDSLAIAFSLLHKLWERLHRLLDEPPQDKDLRLLGKTGSVIDAVNTLSGAQARLMQLQRQTADSDDEDDRARRFAEKLRAAQLEMDALTRGMPADA